MSPKPHPRKSISGLGVPVARRSDPCGECLEDERPPPGVGAGDVGR